MDWGDKCFAGPDYFESVRNSIASGSFIDDELDYAPITQVGVWVVERADIVIRDSEDYEPSTVKAAIEAFGCAMKAHPQLVAAHIQNSIRSFGYTGILDTSNDYVRELWRQAHVSLKDGSWLKALAVHILTDDAFLAKVEAVGVYLRRDMDDDEILEQIEQDSIEANYTNTSASSLVEMGILLI